MSMPESVIRDTDWLKWRQKGIGASDAPAVAGVSRYRSRYQVWLEKTGQTAGQPENEAMRWGKWLEPLIQRAYEERTGLTIVPDSVQRRCEHVNYSWMRSTIDGLNSDGEIVELKAAGLNTARQLGEDGDTDSIPVEWMIQVQHQMATANVDRADIAVFHPALCLRIYPVTRNDDLIEALIETESNFWSNVRTGEPPPPETVEDYLDWSKRSGGKGSRIALDNAEAIEAATNLQGIRAAIKHSEQVESECKYAIIRHLAGHEYGDLADGRIIRAQTVEIAERTQTAKAHTQLRISIKERKS